MTKIIIPILISLLASCLAACDLESGSFRPDVTGTVHPWTHERFDAAEDKFTFAVFSDLAGGESGVDLMAGLLDKTGHVPLGGDDVCFEQALCGESEAD